MSATIATPITTATSAVLSSKAPKATPRLRTWTRSTNGNTSSLLPSFTSRRTSALVIWSTSSTTASTRPARPQARTASVPADDAHEDPADDLQQQDADDR